MENLKIIKRDGSEVDYDQQKIIEAIKNANKDVAKEDRIDCTAINNICKSINATVLGWERTPTVEEIQDLVESALVAHDKYKLAKAYIIYRYEHQLSRENKKLDDIIYNIVGGTNEVVNQENSNKNPSIAPTQRDYIAGEVSKDMSRRLLLPKRVIDAHDNGEIHFHDMDYFIQKIYNCCLCNIKDMLQNGTVINGTLIEPPTTFSTACTIVTQIIAQVSSNQYGGQTVSLAHISPFVQKTREKRERFHASRKHLMTDEEWHDLIESEVKEDIKNGVQTIQYQINTLMTTNGQAPFISVFMDLGEVPEGPEREDLALVIEEVLNQRIQGVKNIKGVWITPAFPKLLFMLDEMNIHPDSKYYYLLQLAAKCTAKRMVPDYISAKVMRELKKGDTYPCMGCRSFLTPDRFTDVLHTNLSKAKDYVEGEHRYYGRFNQGVVTINLVDVALSSGGNEDKFWDIFDERLELCHEALRCRHERLLGTTSDVSPILFQHGAIARLEKGEVIDELLYHGYSTISLGYAGLYECTKYMTGESQSQELGKEFALKVMQHMNDKTAEWKAAEDIDYSLYGTPLESTTYKFAKALQRKFGIIEGITDRGYITNSYHVPVFEEIDAFSKLSKEAEFQQLSPGGAISYIEVPNLNNNIDVVISLIKFMYDNIMYAEINTKSDYCQECGYDGEIKIVEEEGTGKLVWECPNCGNRDKNKLNVARRTCGYIGTYFWNQGRTQEIKDRVLHL